MNSSFWKSLASRSSGKLDPLESINEVIFGLIMVLTFTCTINAATEGGEDVKTVLWAALGCNVAWGIIDAYIYLYSVILNRGSGLQSVRLIRQAKSDAAANEVIADSLPPLISNLMKEEQYAFFRGEIKKLPEPPKKTILTWSDLLGAVKVFMLVFLSTFPVAIPFLLIQDVFVAMRVSNAVALLLLFITGLYFGKKTSYPPFISGLMFAGIGALLVGMTIALGG